MRFFLCIALTPPYNQGITSNQIIEKWNILTSFYIKLAGRFPRPAEMREQLRLLANIDAPSDRESAAARIIYSDEHLRPLVDIVYETFLGRDASRSEEDHWIGRFRNGLKYEDFVVDIAASQERRNRLGARTVTALINAMVLDNYAKMLGRQASARGSKSERAYWLRFVQNTRRAGKTLAAALRLMTAGIVQSDENRWKVAEHMVKRVLEDAATWQLIKTAFDKLKVSEGNLLETMKWAFGTNEYFQKNRRRFVSQLTREWCEENADDFFNQFF
jgi:hypothetical protein